MAVSLAGGVVRPRLYEVGTDPGPAIEVPRRINVIALAEALNKILNDVAPEGEVPAFEAVTAAAFAQGIEHQRRLMEVA
jgi:hypothetical protein